MASNHSMYKKPSKQKKATPFDKANSKYQLKINIMKKHYKKLQLRNSARLHQVRLLSKACNKLVEDGIVPREYFSPYMPKLKDVYKILEEKRNG